MGTLMAPLRVTRSIHPYASVDRPNSDNQLMKPCPLCKGKGKGKGKDSSNPTPRSYIPRPFLRSHPGLGSYATQADPPKVIVLDLDETLIHTSTEDDMSSLYRMGILTDPQKIDLRQRIFFIEIDDAVGKRGYGDHEKMWAIKRPNLDEFLDFCFQYFDLVIVWSAGADRYVHSVVDNIFRDHPEPHVVYGRSECVTDPRAGNYKPLKKMMRKVSGIIDRMMLSNTFVIDDKESTYIDNVDNGIKIPAYEPRPIVEELRDDDQALIELMDWLEQDVVKSSKNVQTLDKGNIFTI